uniref:PH domain-containing protein n=1 Tax=Clytia hemisphaerica TaxID=252671 RepID=A0A7M5UPG8_9CNID
MAELPGIQYDKTKIYHKEVILKKEGKTWIEYYAVLVDKHLVFNRKDSKTGQIIPHNVTMIEISNKTFCGFDDHKKKCYRFPFWIETGKTKYQFKCETKLHRYRWLYAIRLCASGKPPGPVPKMIPTVQRNIKPRKPTDPSKNGTQANGKISRTRNQTQSLNRSANGGTLNRSANGSITNHKKGNLTRSKSIDSGLLDNSTPRVEKRSNNNNTKSMKTLSTKDLLPQRSRSFNERLQSLHKSKSSSWISRRLYGGSKHVKTDTNKTDAVKKDVNVKDSVVENRFVRDSMSDVQLSEMSAKLSINIEDVDDIDSIDGVKKIIVVPKSIDLNSSTASKMTLNDRFKSMSCEDVLSVERTDLEPLERSINGVASLAKSMEALDFEDREVELYLGEDGQKTPTEYTEVVELNSKKQPCENDESEYPELPTRPSSSKTSSKRDITELFQARKHSLPSFSSADSPYRKRYKGIRRGSKIASRISLESIGLARANSWASFVGIKKMTEPRRRENSAPSLKGTRIQSHC